MAKWRQDKKTGKLIPIDESARRRDGVITSGPFQSFVSIVDGTLVSSRRKLAEHNKRNNVVSAAEFTPEFYERKAKERARLYTGSKTREESFKCRQQIYDTWIEAERNG